MADAKISALTAVTTLAAEDLYAMVDDPSGSPVTKKATHTQLQTLLKSIGITAGKHTIWVPAAAMTAATTSGATSGQIETTTNKINYPTLDFVTGSDTYAHFNVAMPKSYNLSTVTYQVWWSTTATGTTGVAWALQGVAISDNTTSDTAYGTAVVVTDDAQSGANEILITAESGAVTIANTPADDDICFFRVFRDVSDANDDMTEDALLLGIKLLFTTDAENDT